MKLSPYQARVLRLMEEHELKITQWRRRVPGTLRAQGNVDWETRQQLDRTINESIKRNKILQATLEALFKKGCIKAWLSEERSFTEIEYYLTDKGREEILNLSPEDFISPCSKNTNLSVAFIEDALKIRHPYDRGWVMFTEVVFWGGRRIDVLFFNRWWSKKYKLIAYEIKRSRGNFLHEIKHPDKRKPVMEQVDQFFFAAPKGLIKPAEIPEDTGLVEVSSEGLVRMKKRAPQLDRPDPTWHLIGTLLNNTVNEYEDRLDKAVGFPKRNW